MPRRPRGADAGNLVNDASSPATRVGLLTSRLRTLGQPRLFPQLAWLRRQERRPFGSAGLTLIVLVTFAGLACLGWVGAETRGELQLASQRALKISDLRGVIAHLDEHLTMSARMAAASGDARWIARYEEAEPLLNAAITEAVALATPSVATELSRTTDEANQRLIDMERASFALVAAGDRAGAASLLDSQRYDDLKQVYASGVAAFSRELEMIAASQIAKLSRRAWLEVLWLTVGAVLLVAIVSMSHGHARLRSALARTEAVARTDALTDLPNRRRLYEELRSALARMERSGGGVALLILDLDRFKAINDAHGHPAGDKLLQLVAARLQDTARAGDLVARLGGDEFALVASLNAAIRPQSHGAIVKQLAKRIVTALRQPFDLGCGTQVQVGTSIGVAVAQPGGEDADGLVHRADIALYQAKAGGRSRFHVFEPGMDERIRARALLEADLRQAVADDLIVPHFQPLIEITSGRVIGFEMLARWSHPGRGMVSPGEFVPVAEEVGLIGPMTDRLLRRACRLATSWPAGMLVACNISPLQLRDRGLLAMVQAALKEAGLPAHRLELEITESALIGDFDLALEILGELRALGVRLALDDFGTGYSSLRHLQLLPIDKIKIDASFIRTMTHDVESRKIVAAVIGLGHSLGLSMVAEGVEEAETAQMLRNLGCDVGQGWLFGRPAAAEAIAALLSERAQA